MILVQGCILSKCVEIYLVQGCILSNCVGINLMQGFISCLTMLVIMGAGLCFCNWASAGL
jgi:hypothetical protein